MTHNFDAGLATAGKPCVLGTDPAKYKDIFDEWLEHIDLLVTSLGVKDDDQKLNLLLLWGGRDLRKLAKAAGVDTKSDPPTSYKAAITKIQAHFGKHVNLSMAVFRLMHARQGEKTVTEFLDELDTLSTQCQFDTNPYTQERAKKDAYIFGTSDDRLRQEALAKDPDLQTLIKTALGYEQARKSSGAIKSETGEPVARIALRGRYSTNRGAAAGPRPSSQKCKNCPPHYRPHPPGRCPARGKTCALCGEKNHFVGAVNCTKAQVRFTADEEDEAVYKFEEDEGNSVGRVVEVGAIRPEHANVVQVSINGKGASFFVDSGCHKTLIPERNYHPSLGKLEASSVKLRPYGTVSLLQVKGEMRATLQSRNGARCHTTVYVIDGHLAEPLLGDEDAKALGILHIDAGGGTVREALPDADIDCVAGIVHSLEATGVKVEATRSTSQNLSDGERSKIQRIVKQHEKVFEGVGLLKDDEVSFHIDPEVPPVAAPYRPVPLAYQERLSAHLAELRSEGKIEDVGPREECPWISNVVITEKKEAGKIRMNIDMRESNKAIRRTPRHVTSVSEMRHMLAGATVFSELDMTHGFHQLALAEESRTMGTFRTHEGLHRFKVLFFGASPASDIFHDRISATLRGLTGCTSIHDNILVWGKTADEHAANLDACLQRLEDRGLTLRKEKCTFGSEEVNWFGWIFSKSGMSADPRKVNAIREAGPPQSNDDVRSFLQACQYNARFMFSSEQAYAQLTKPLRELTRKHARFVWSKDCDQAYQNIMEAMTCETALRPFNPKRPTKLVTDAGPDGIAASLFQVTDDGTWTPIDHASRSLTQCEQRYCQFEKESLAQTWGMNVHRHYLLGIQFDSVTDHKPLLAVYNGKKRGNARVERHKLKTQEFQFKMVHLPGKENPCDYASRHPMPLSSYPAEQLEDMILEHNDEICINAVISDDTPDAITPDTVRRATARDQQSQKLIQCIQQGYLTQDPDLTPFRQIFREFSYSRGVLLREDRLYIPTSEPEPGAGSLRQQVVELAHEGHQGAGKTKRLLRARVWFPRLDALVDEKIASCLACQASTSTPTRDPLKPTTLPERPWQRVAADFWGPLSSGEHLLVVIDEYSRYPEVEITSSTSGTATIPVIDKIFATHGIPESVKTDGGPPFNRHEFAMYARWAGFKHRKVSPEDPEANGLAEVFMKTVKKTWHAARIEGKNPKQELYKLLRQYRATPHPSTGKPPAELLFNRPYHTRLPAFRRPTHATSLHREVQTRDATAKSTQKGYKDNRKNVRTHNIRTGDAVLLQRRTTKSDSRYDPDPYKVTQQMGTQITVTRGQTTLTRDSQKFKRISRPQRPNYRRQRFLLALHSDSEEPWLGPDFRQPTPSPTNTDAAAPATARSTAAVRQPSEDRPPAVNAPTIRQSARERRPPRHLSDYVLT